MTSNSSFFLTYEKVEGRNVTMGNEAWCLVLSVGDFKFIIFNGVVITLFGVLHVPRLNRPLIFLGTLDKGDFKCIDEGGALKVF